jgi:hypothetical protein
MKTNNILYYHIYVSWTRLEGGKRVHIPILTTLLFVAYWMGQLPIPVWLFLPIFLLNSCFITKVQNRFYVVVGFIFIEWKLYFAPPPNLPEMTTEQLLHKHKYRFLTYMKYRDVGDVVVASKKVGVSRGNIEQLAGQMGYIVEENKIFHK